MTRKLLLYLDVNQTITVVDTAAGKTLSDGINCALARAAWIRRIESSPSPVTATTSPPRFADFQWHDGSPLVSVDGGSEPVAPPLVRYGGPDSAHSVKPFNFIDTVPSGCLCYYDVFGKELSKRFAIEGPGVMYKPVADELMEKLEWPVGMPCEDSLVTEHAGKKYHMIVPSLFKLFLHLKEQGIEFKVILHTMGHNIGMPAAVFELFAQNRHPVFASNTKRFNFDNLRCQGDVGWRLHVNSVGPSQFLLESEHTDGDKLESEQAIYSFMTVGTKACGVNSSFQKWEGQGFLAAAGKRLWLTADDDAVHPIMFDDNIKKSEDSVVAVRARRSPEEPFATLSPEQTLPLHDAILLQADIVQAILNPNYFVDSVAKCRANLPRLARDPQFRAALDVSARTPSH